ncbi:SDR family oxidoreductase [Ligilactobacillus pobuzihii]|nr:SDR family oxidoreductase [Ligilactobacillus pobuzihii]
MNDVPLEAYYEAQKISSFSLLSVNKCSKVILNEGASIVTLTYIDSQKGIPNYQLM